uniref:MHC class II antigen alpha n=2 Tax=Cynoglossus semilaevis TaxID=244447 RepID=G9BDC5_CYNSE|nr:MHC class II antigen alpha [Cynoglossus semilaevis]
MTAVTVSVLVLTCVLGVSAGGLHVDLAVVGCSDTDGEQAYNLDGEEVWYADFVNKRGVEPQPSFIDHMSYEEGVYANAEANQQICRSSLKAGLEAIKDIPLENDPPSTPMIYSRDVVETGAENTLICHVTGFYPAPVKVMWTKNNQNVTEGVSINVPYPNDDSTYRQTSRLEFVPQPGDIYSCSVQHPALHEPLTQMWEVEVEQPSVGPAVFCAVGLTLGLFGVAAGTFFLIKGNECR